MKATADLVSDGYFSMYNGRAHIGRLLVPGESSDASASPAAVVSYPFWRRELSGDSSVIGRTLRLTNGLQLTVVGVANERFSGASSGLGAQPADFWLPLVVRNRMPTFQRGDQQSISPFTDANAEWLSMSAQLPEGVLLEQATLHLRNLLTHLPTADSANVNDLTSPLLTQGRRGFINRNNALSISFALSATAMVLLIGCANVANLVLARGVRRRREIAVRLSLGASRVRLIRQLMTESAMLGLAGGLAAIIVSQVILKILSASEILVFLKVDAETLARGLKPDAYVIVFTFIMAFVSATASGLVPSLRSTKMNLSRATRDDGAAIGTRRSRSRLRTGLVIGQVALSLALLNTATALLRSSANANESDVGFDYQKVVTIAALRSGNGYSNARFLNYLHELQERTTQLVGPENVARGTILLTGSGGMNFARVSPSEPGLRSTPLALASANYFTVLGLPIVRGRAFTELEARNSAPVVIISESTAKQYWPTTDALGQRLKLADEQWSESTGRRVLQNERDVMVVGVAHDAQTVIVGSARNPMMYAPADSGSVLVRASENPATLARTLRELARVTDRDMIANVRTQDEVMHSIVHSADITSKYTGVLGTFGLLLSAIGIFGVVAYTVSQRTHEIGIRLAIGAQPFDVMRLMLVQGMRPVLLGIAMGVAATAMVSRGLLAGFSGISPFDPVAYLTAAAIVASVALVACYVPSRRATTIDPVGAIRSE